MRSLDWHHIVDCYGISPEILTEDFISKYGNYNHMKWFRAYKQLRDVDTNNKIAVEAIIPRDIDDRVRYKANDVKTHTSRSAKKSGLKTIRAKLGLLNSVLYTTYGLKLKAIDKNLKYYHLIGSFDSKDALELPLYQTGEEVYWGNGKNT
ncbi:hypothetical protein RhiirB3_454457 [Rhizophagus irregularis]|nr:hypothetical protein RhiirB3_454457 [Rhizophagus irregularis]